MPLYIAKSGDLDRCYRCLTDRLTDSQTKFAFQEVDENIAQSDDDDHHDDHDHDHDGDDDDHDHDP